MKTILVLGPTGTYSHQAAVSAFDNADKHIQFAGTNRQVLEGVMTEECFGVVPIENSTEGPVRPVIDYWLESKKGERPIVVGQISLKIVHRMLSFSGADITSIDQWNAVASHPQALAQCRKNLEGWPMLKTRIPTESTAGAARDLANGTLPPTCVVLASELAGNANGLHVGCEMQDFANNTTRFHVIAHPRHAEKMRSPLRNGRTAMLFRVDDKPCAHALAELAIGAEGVNMTSMHTIPLGNAGEFAFYVEFDEHLQSEGGKKIMKRLETLTLETIVLGSFSQIELWKVRQDER
jgi:chorismate mutase/prephenate dehydratase